MLDFARVIGSFWNGQIIIRGLAFSQQNFFISSVYLSSVPQTFFHFFCQGGCVPEIIFLHGSWGCVPAAFMASIGMLSMDLSPPALQFKTAIATPYGLRNPPRFSIFSIFVRYFFRGICIVTLQSLVVVKTSFLQVFFLYHVSSNFKNIINCNLKIYCYFCYRLINYFFYFVADFGGVQLQENLGFDKCFPNVEKMFYIFLCFDNINFNNS